MIKTLIKSMLKVAAFGAFIFELIGTKESKPEGNVQLHPVKLSGRTLFIREQEIFIRESYLDNKPILVLLHSWGSDSLGSWFKTIPLLQDSYSIVAIDLKNHGRTDGSWTRWDITENADMVATVLKELGIEKSILIGWSIGSAVSLAVSKNYPELVSKQVLVTPFAWTVNAEYKEKPWFSIVNNNLEESVEIKEEVGQKEVIDYLSKSSLLVLPSKSEGLGRVILEAQAVGCPVLVSDAGGMKDLIEHKKTGFIFKNEDLIDLGDNIEFILKNNEIVNDITQSGKENVIEFYKSNSFLNGYKQIFEKV